MSRKRPAHVQQSGVNIVDNKVEGLITYTAPVLADAVVLIQWSTPEAPQTTQPNQLFRLCLITANQDPTGLTGLDTDVDWDVCSCVRRAVSSSRSARTDRLSILRPRPSSLSPSYLPTVPPLRFYQDNRTEAEDWTICSSPRARHWSTAGTDRDSRGEDRHRHLQGRRRRKALGHSGTKRN